jgi:DHA1 family multidrug resistance protein-like MFS transporter
VGLSQSGYYIALAIFAPIWGHLSDVLGKRMMLIRSLFGAAVGVVLMLFARTPWQFLLLRIALGCLAGSQTAATVLTAGIVPASEIAFTLGLLQTGVALGNILGPLIGGIISDFMGHRMAFLAGGLVLAIAGFIVLKGVDDDRHEPKTGVKSKKKTGLKPDFRIVFHAPVLLLLLLPISFALQAATNMVTPMLPLFLKELSLNNGGSIEYIGSSTGLVLGIGAASTAIATMVAGKKALSLGYWKTLIFCLCAGSILTTPQAFVSSIIQLTIFRALSSFFIGGAIPVLQAIIATSTDKEHQGSVFGINASVSFIGGALGPVIGAAAAMLNYRAVFLVTALMLGVFGALALVKGRG